MKTLLNGEAIATRTLVLLCLFMLLSPAALSDDLKPVAAADPITVSGMLNVDLDDQLQVKSAKLVTEEAKVFNIITDENGLKLAGEASGRKVQVTGAPVQKDEKQWLKVTEWMVLPEEKR